MVSRNYPSRNYPHPGDPTEGTHSANDDFTLSLNNPAHPPFREGARDVVMETASRDVGQGFDLDLFHDLEDRPRIDTGRPQQLRPPFPFDLFLAEDFSRQRISVAVEAARGQPDERIARPA